MTKRQTEQWHMYLDRYRVYGTRDLNQAYGTYSSKKYNAWCKIRDDKVEKNGSYLTVTSAGSHFFSTDFLYKEGDTWHWVHDCYSYRSDIKLTDKMITEAKEAGICLVI